MVNIQTVYEEKRGCGYRKPGVFKFFRPDRIEYVITGNETDEELTAIEKRGITLVEVRHVGEPVPMEFDDDPE